MVNNLPNAGIPAPIPDTFDFAGQMTRPEALEPSTLTLQSRNKLNRLAEQFNSDSTEATTLCRDDRANHPDVGPKLRPYYKYTAEEIDDMARSDRLVDQSGPIPIYLIRILEKRKLEVAEEDKKKKEAAKLKSSVKGTLESRLVPQVQVNSFGSVLVPIPEAYLNGILTRTICDLHFWTKACLQEIHLRPKTLITKELKPPKLDGETEQKSITVVNIEAMNKIWGSDDSYSCITAFEYLEALDNVLRAVDYLSTPPTPSHSKFSYVAEFSLHVAYVKQIEDFQYSYVFWYPWEKEMRTQILCHGVRFDAARWTQELGFSMGMYKQSQREMR